MKDKVSVIIPVHNGSQYLNKTVKTLLKQNYDNFEIILVENNSTDQSWSICESFQGKDKRVRAYSVKTKGTTLARKYGVLHAKGKYILFHDQDDRILDHSAINKMVSAIKHDQMDICQFGYIKLLGGIIKKKVPQHSKYHVQIFNPELFMTSGSCP